MRETPGFQIFMLQYEAVLKGKGKPPTFHWNRNVKNKNTEGMPDKHLVIL